MKTGQSGGYDAWGVKFPNGKIREFSTLDKCQMYVAAMNGKDVLQPDGSFSRMDGLVVVHRFIPTWTEIPDTLDE